MKYLLLCVVFLVSGPYDKQIIKSFASNKCHCFEELIKQGEDLKRKYDREKQGEALFGGTAVSMNLDSCAYTLLPANHRSYINHLDSVQLIQFYARVNQTLASNCKAVKKYK